MSPAFDDVTGGKPLTELRRNNRSADQRQPHLTTMCMAGQSERDATRNHGKHVRVMGKQDHGSAILFHRVQCGGDIVRARPQVADARDPHWTSWRCELCGGLLEHANAVSLESVPDPGMAQP